MDTDLYAAPREEFVAMRAELAKELAAAGNADEAKRVKALRKPTVTAWTLNRVVREEPGLVAALVAAHEAMRSAGSAADVRAASAARMSAIREIAAAADDVSEAVRKKVRSTLLAAGTDPSAEQALVEGRLERELEPGGLGGFGIGLDLAPAPSRDGQPVQDDKPVEEAAPKPAEKAVPVERAQSAKVVKARERAERWRKEADEAAGEARALRKAAERADRKAVVAEERAATKLRRAEDALRALEAD